MARCLVRLEGSSACDAKVVHEVQVGCVVRQQSNKSVLSGTDPESLQSHTSTDTERSDTFLDSLDLPILITEVFRSGRSGMLEKS